MVPQGARSALKHVFMYWLLKLLSKSVVWWLRSETFTEKCIFLKMLIFDIFVNFAGNAQNHSEIVPGASKHRSKISGGLKEGLRIVFFCRFEENAKNDEKSYLSIQSTSFFSPRRVLRTLPPAEYDGGAPSPTLTAPGADDHLRN